MLARLEERLPLLTRGPRDLPERQRTLRATIEWSYVLLEPGEQRAFARLSVFAGGCTLELADTVCECSLETLESLVDKSLITVHGDRFVMLETIREYARERLVAIGEDETVEEKLADELLLAAETFAVERERGGLMHLEHLDAELDNIRAAMRAAIGRPDDPVALRFAAALARFWTSSGRPREGLSWTAQALEAAGKVSSTVRAQALQAAAILAALSGDAQRARRFGEEALTLYRLDGDDRRVADVLRWLAHAHLDLENPARARELHAESVALAAGLDSPVHLSRALRIAGEDELVLGDTERAESLFARALEQAREAGATNDIVWTLFSLGDVALVRRRATEAATFFLEALHITSDDTMSAYCLAGLAAVAALAGLPETAGRLWGAVESHQERLGEPLMDAEMVRRYEIVLAGVAGDSFSEALQSGRAVRIDEASREAVEAFTALAGSPAGGPSA
jgi:tetratricopeptide (TPR) repeat protein